MEDNHTGDHLNSTYRYTYEFSFESNFDIQDALKWSRANWSTSILYSAVYMALVFWGKKYMENRPRYELRGPLTLWSGTLAVFSILGAIRTVPEVSHILRHYGWQHSVCNPSYFYGSTGIWSYLFMLSKVYELGDTIFIVMRKQPLILLHWYHHVTVLIYSWYSYTFLTAPGRWFMTMNYVIHSLMYTYYTLKAMRVRVPKHISMIITVFQICQMIMGLLINYTAYQAKKRGDYCNQTSENIWYSTLMYLSYFVLFIFFFYNSYVNSKRKDIKPAVKRYTENGDMHDTCDKGTAALDDKVKLQ